MKRLLPLLALLVAGGPARAQAPPRAAGPDSLTAPLATAPAAPDTLSALHRLFGAKRRQLSVLLLSTAAADLAGELAVSTTLQSGGAIDDRAIGQFFVVVLAVPVVLAEVLLYAPYTPKREQRAVARLRAYQLSPRLRRQLKAQYFR